MILDIDIGNSYLKWRLIDGSDVIKKGSQIVDSILAVSYTHLTLPTKA